MNVCLKSYVEPKSAYNISTHSATFIIYNRLFSRQSIPTVAVLCSPASEYLLC